MRAHDRAACRRQPLHDIVIKAGEEARCVPAMERIYRLQYKRRFSLILSFAAQQKKVWIVIKALTPFFH